MGLRKALERGLWRLGKKLSHWRFILALELFGLGTGTDTDLCLRGQVDDPSLHRKTKRVSNPECLVGGDCCADAILSAREDFRSVRSHLQAIVEDAGHIFLLCPEFHCELD